jgi:hypothetical protein
VNDRCVIAIGSRTLPSMDIVVEGFEQEELPKPTRWEFRSG